MATAEALSALAAAGRGNGTAGRRARAWLVNHSYESLDHRARAVRALAATGGVPAALADFDHPGGTPAATGWGPVAPDDGVTCYDSALVMAAIRASGDLGTDLSSPLAEVIARRRSDDGWSGDDLPSSVGASDPTATAEVVRALSGSRPHPSIS